MITIGLFGTCGGSKWRDPFIEKYKQLGYSFFNPQVDDWRPEYANIEAKHLVEDEIILFPVTDETYGLGSLAETGFSINQVLKSAKNRSVVLLIEPRVKEELEIANPSLAKESMRSRALVTAHLKQVNHPNVYFVNNLEDMLRASLKLYSVHNILKQLRNETNGTS